MLFCLRIVAGAEEKNKVILNGDSDISMFRSAVAGTAFRHSEILSNVIERRVNIKSLSSPGNLAIDDRVHPFAIILSPDCDLDWDFKTRFNDHGNSLINESFNGKEIPTILLCEVVEAQTLRNRQDINSSIWNNIRRNKDQRYHFISSIQTKYNLNGKDLPEFAIDFKRYFTIPTAELYWQVNSGDCKRHTWLGSTYLEHLSHRFGNFMSRVALPQDYESL